MRHVIVGHGSSYHDPALAVLEGEHLYAEALERHTQCKRSLSNFGLWYSWDAVQSALTSLGVLPLDRAQIRLRSSWSIPFYLLPALRALQTATHFAQHREPVPPGGFRPLVSSQLEMEETFQVQMAWMLQGSRTKEVRSPTHPRYRARVKDHSLSHETMDHHLAHAATAVYTSPFEECVVAIIDGGGEAESTTFYHYTGGTFKRLTPKGKPKDSLGFLYAAVTLACGFDVWEGEEWKVMGLAGYGQLRREIYDFFMSRTKVDGLSVSLDLDVLNSPWETQLAAVAGPLRRDDDPDVLKAADLAHSFQQYFTDVVCELTRNARRLGLSRNLAYGGGCALNSSTNGVILERSGFDRLHVPSAPADDGNALGVALYEKHHVQKRPRRLEITSPYLGSSVDLENLERVLRFDGVRHRKYEDEEALCAAVADLLAEGKIIGWMQGRAEFGPRALGNRSILADPRPPWMKDAINKRVKFREEYRPLAPSILHEHGGEYFEDYQESPYMERTLRFRASVRDKVPAVVHVDGTGRLQTVKREWNPLYHRLISAFHRKTGVPILLNTSFNVMGKPIVHSVIDAITVFFTTDLDHLVIGPYLLIKRGDQPGEGARG